MKWDLPPEFRAHEGGFILGEQVFCVQNGFASQRFLENTVRLVTTCFGTNAARLLDELDQGGIAWDFIVAVYRGEDVNDVVSACILVYGQQSEVEMRSPFNGIKRQYFYVFNVSTHPGMARRGLAKVVLDAVYRLGCLALQSDYWGKGVMAGFSGELWLLIEVDLEHKLVLQPEKLVKLYSEVGYVPCPSFSVPVTPIEPWRKRWMWTITVDPAVKRQMWMRVVPGNGEQHSRVVTGKVLDELRSGSVSMAVIASRFEWLLDRGLFFDF